MADNIMARYDLENYVQELKDKHRKDMRDIIKMLEKTSSDINELILILRLRF